MEVVQGSIPSTNQGMFRPFFECWQAFNASIKQQSQGMSQVHCLRLDLHRYYDNLRRMVLRDALRNPLRTLFEELDNNGLKWFGLFQEQVAYLLLIHCLPSRSSNSSASLGPQEPTA